MKYRIECWRQPNNAEYFVLLVTTGRWPFRRWVALDTYPTKRDAYAAMKLHIGRPVLTTVETFRDDGSEIH